ncbi:hypothetical protein Tco_0918854 [Tanacetum coccineum]
MPGRSMTEAIHLLRSLMEKYRERQRDLHIAFLHPEKAYDSILHDIVLIAESAKGLNIKLEKYKVVHQEMDIRIGDRILQPKESFRYLASGVLCDKRIPLKLNGKFYRVAIRPTMIYGSMCWSITKAQANRVEVAELRMLRWTYGKSMVDMISNRVFRAKLNVDSIIDKMRERRLRWFGHLKRRPQTAPVRRVEAMVVDGSRRRGRPKLRWDDRLKQDMKELRLSEDMTYDKNAWRDRIRTSK